jgi:hypothetical protein
MGTWGRGDGKMRCGRVDFGWRGQAVFVSKGGQSFEGLKDARPQRWDMFLMFVRAARLAAMCADPTNGGSVEALRLPHREDRRDPRL